jgi:hypothetical protein
MKIRPVGADVSHADREADGHEEANSQTLFSILRKRQKNWFLRQGKAS